jgi:hypothetical protein
VTVIDGDLYRVRCAILAVAGPTYEQAHSKTSTQSPAPGGETLTPPLGTKGEPATFVDAPAQP